MAVRTVSRCECGKVKSRHSGHCKKCDAKLHARSVANAKAVVRTGRCPQCGAGLRYNGAIAGWWQCAQYGSDGFRKDPTKPSCLFQCFTA